KVTIEGKTYPLHRVIFLLVEGRWPNGVIKHKDGRKDNNAWRNLVEVPYHNSISVENTGQVVPQVLAQKALFKKGTRAEHENFTVSGIHIIQ
ncbi:MAG: HNH endonuclease, partial [Dissulfuribacterales bacterium]